VNNSEIAEKIVESVLAILGYGEDHPDYQACIEKANQILESATQIEETPKGGYFYLG
jgi:hypothetical protein